MRWSAPRVRSAPDTSTARARARPNCARESTACCGRTLKSGTFWVGVGTRAGPYKILEQIGEGGFGVVFMAEQEHPVRRRVALKVIKPGMDTRQVIARFEACLLY